MIFEGRFIQLESQGPVQLILSCMADLLDAGRFSELQLANLVTLVRTRMHACSCVHGLCMA